MEINANQQSLIDNYKFKVSTSGKTIILRDSGPPVRKFEGDDLQELIDDAVAARNGLAGLNGGEPDDKPAPKTKKGAKAKDETPPDPPSGSTRRSRTSNPNGAEKNSDKNAKAKEPDKQPDAAEKPAAAKNAKAKDFGDGKGDLKAASLDDTGGKKKKEKKGPAPKKRPSEWRTGIAGMIVLKNFDKTPEAIYGICKKEGIKTTQMTVKGLHRYFLLCMALLADWETDLGEKPLLDFVRGVAAKANDIGE